MTPYEIKRGDLLPAISATLKLNAAAYSLTGYTVRFLMRNALTGAVKVSASATVDSPSAGTVHYDWVSGDTDTAGDYYCEWAAVRVSDGKVVTFPNSSTLQALRITDNIH